MRRTLMAILLGLFGLTSLAGCSGLPQAVKPAQVLVIGVAPGAMDPDLLNQVVLPAFTRRWNVRVEVQTGLPYEKFAAAVQGNSRNTTIPDVYLLPDRLLPTAVKDRVAAPLKWAEITRQELVPHAVHGFGVASCGYAMLMVNDANTSGVVTRQEWADFYLGDITPDGRTLPQTPVDTLEWALLAGGIHAENLYPLDLDLAFRQLDRLYPHVRVWWQTDAQAVKALEAPEVALGAMRSDVAQKAQISQPGLVMHWSQAILHWDYWVMPPQSRNPAAALNFLSLVLDTRMQAEMAGWSTGGSPGDVRRGCSPSNLNALALLDPAAAEGLATYPANLTQDIDPDIEWWAENYAAAASRFESWLKTSP